MSKLNSSKIFDVLALVFLKTHALWTLSLYGNGRKQNAFNFIVSQPKETILGVLNAESEVTMIFRTADNYIPFNPA
jgi:hypothetical protein